MSTNTLSAVRKFKTSYGDHLFQPAIAEGMPGTILGYPVYEDETMPDIAANSL